MSTLVAAVTGAALLSWSSARRPEGRLGSVGLTDSAPSTGRLDGGAGGAERTRSFLAEPHRAVWVIPIMVVIAAAVAGVEALGWVAAAGVAGGSMGWIAISAVRRRRAKQAAEQTAHAARLLASLLRAGQIPTVALAEAATECPSLARAAAASKLGSDVASELARSSRSPGRDGMGLMAAAWRVSERSGAPIAAVLATVAENLRHRRQLEALLETELAAARTSGRIMAALPFLALALGVLGGGDPLGFLLHHELGQWLILAGVVLTAAGVVWIDRLATARTSP